MAEFLKEINWSPLWISLKTGLVATVIAFFLGVFCARKIMKLRPGAKAAADCSRLLPASDLQSQETSWKLSP